MKMAKILAKKEPKFLKFENFVIFLLEYEIQWKKTKLLVKQLFSKVAFLILALFGSFWPKMKKALWRKVVLIKVWSFSIIFHVPREK